MASSLRNGVPVTFTGKGLSDAADGTNASQGAMHALTNMIPDPTTKGNWVCRPAAVDVVSLPGEFPTSTFVSTFMTIGNLVYGMVGPNASLRDDPFVYDLVADVFLPVTGATDANTPLSQPSTGDWVPPIMAQVSTRILVTHPGFPGGDIKFGWFDIGGFSDTVTGNTYEQLTFVGDTDPASNPLFIYGVPPGTLPGDGQIGFTVTGTNIPANTTLVAFFDVAAPFVGDATIATAVIANVPDTSELYVGMVVQSGVFPAQSQILTIVGSDVTLDQNATASQVGAVFSALGRQIQISNAATGTADGVIFTFSNANVISGNPSIFGLQPGLAISGTGVAAGSSITKTATVTSQAIATITAGSNSAFVSVDPGGLSIGMEVAGIGIPIGATVLSHGGNLIILSEPATTTGLTTLFFTGTQIWVTPSLTGSVNGVTLTISGGTEAAPLWAAGDTAPAALSEKPTGVSQMNGRAWFALPDGSIPWSDSLLPCVRTSDTQALIADDRRPITAIAPLMLSSPISGGIVQSLIAFQGVSAMHQIIGDPATNTLTFNIMPVQTGTHAPNTITPATQGTYFVSPEGLRLITVQGQISDPIGQDGSGVVAPFLEVTTPPYLTDAPASRMTAAAGGRTLRIDVPVPGGTMASYWYDLTRSIWTGPHTGGAALVKVWQDTFLIEPFARGALLQRADDMQRPYSVFVENGRALDFEWESCLLPDTSQMAMNTIIESEAMVALPPDESIQIDFLSEVRAPIDGYTMSGFIIPEGVWAQAIWGMTYLGPDSGLIRQRQVMWTQPIVFKQGRVNIRGVCSSGITIGNFYMRVQVDGYLQEIPQIAPAAAVGDFFLLSNDGFTILRNNGPVNLRPNGQISSIIPTTSGLLSNDGVTVLIGNNTVIQTVLVPG